MYVSLWLDGDTAWTPTKLWVTLSPPSVTLVGMAHVITRSQRSKSFLPTQFANGYCVKGKKLDEITLQLREQHWNSIQDILSGSEESCID